MAAGEAAVIATKTARRAAVKRIVDDQRGSEYRKKPVVCMFSSEGEYFRSKKKIDQGKENQEEVRCGPAVYVGHEDSPLEPMSTPSNSLTWG